MARKKVKLEWIANNGTRRAMFKKRRKGLMKKVSELSTLCDVKTCLVVYAPNEAAVEVWPSVLEAVRVLAKLKRMCCEQLRQEYGCNVIKHMLQQMAVEEGYPHAGGGGACFAANRR